MTLPKARTKHLSLALGQSLQLRLRLKEAITIPRELWILLVRHQQSSSNDDDYIGIDFADAGQHLSGISASFSPVRIFYLFFDN